MVNVKALKLRRASRTLEVTFADGRHAALPLEYLRVFSPSAELWGHGRSEPLLVGGKRAVNVARVEPVGRYAVKLVFDDGHDTGLYSWDYLHQLCSQQETLWQQYLERMTAAGASRDPQVQVINFQP